MAVAGVNVNLVLMALNLLPILPLHGGRILFSLLPTPVVAIAREHLDSQALDTRHHPVPVELDFIEPVVAVARDAIDQRRQLRLQGPRQFRHEA